MSQRKRNGRMPLQPTLCEIRTLVPKLTHDILTVAAKEIGVPVSVFVNRIIAVSCQELLKEGVSHERLEPTDGNDSSPPSTADGDANRAVVADDSDQSP